MMVVDSDFIRCVMVIKGFGAGLVVGVPALFFVTAKYENPGVVVKIIVPSVAILLFTGRTFTPCIVRVSHHKDVSGGLCSAFGSTSDG